MREGALVTSPTQRTLAECKRRGWLAYVCEKWIAQARRRVDAFGFGDVLVIDDKPGALLIQATTTSNAPSRVRKVRDECTEAARTWLARGNRILVWGWAKRGRPQRWTLKEYEVSKV